MTEENNEMIQPMPAVDDLASTITILGPPEARAAFWAAFAKAQANFDPIPRNREGQKGNQRFDYATLAQILKCTIPHLSAQGIAFMQHDNNVPGSVTTCITTILSGHGCEIWSRFHFDRPQWGESTSKGPFQVQDFGSLLTYFRRYPAQTILGVEGDRDIDDGDSPASDAPKAEPPRQRRAEPPKTQNVEQRAAPRQEQRREEHRQEQAKPKDASPPQSSTTLYSPEEEERVIRALAKRNTISTVAEVQSATKKNNADPGMVENKVAFILSRLAAQSKIISMKKGGITCYLCDDKELRDWIEGNDIPPGQAENEIAAKAEATPEPESQAEPAVEPEDGPITDVQKDRISECYKILGYNQERARRDIYEKVGVAINELKSATSERLIALLEEQLEQTG